MPATAPGKRFEATATKQVVHGDPAVELGHAGVAFKNAQVAPMAPSVANATIARTIVVGEDFIIDMDGAHEINDTFLPAGAAVGNPLYIRASDNALVLAATALTGGVLNAGFVKYGLLDEIDTTLARATVNLTQRSAF